jgi:hypothetical protein
VSYWIVLIHLIFISVQNLLIDQQRDLATHNERIANCTSVVLCDIDMDEVPNYTVDDMKVK